MSVNSVASGLPPELAVLIAQELAALAADAQSLQGQLNTGDIVAAVVQPSNGLTDVLSIRGLRVAAELPPNLLPGQTIAVEVVGFSDERINLRILPGVKPAPASSAVVAPATEPAQISERVAEPAPISTAGAARPGPPVSANATPTHRSFADVAVPAATNGAGARPRARAVGAIEARIATAHATTRPPAAAASPLPGLTNKPAAGAPPVAPLVARPIMTQRAPTIAPLAPGPAPRLARTAAEFREPAILLRALNLPATATNVAAARSALESPERLPHVLAVLERALAKAGDPQLATLRTLLAFVGRIEPRSPVLAAQVAAFVDHVVTANESKLALLLDPRAASAADDAGNRRTTPLPAPDAKAGPTGIDAAAERVAVRRAALDFDLKTHLMAVTAGHAAADGTPPAAKSAALGAAASAALAAVTSVQLGAAAALAANPSGLAFTLPIALASGFAQAQVRIDRDVPRPGSAPLDGDNFHIAFVLETQHLGTVAIELVTVGRSVTLGVQTEARPAQQAFAGAIAQLTQRLESLNYRVAKAGAEVAPRRPAAAPVPGSAAPAVADPRRLVDTDA